MYRGAGQPEHVRRKRVGGGDRGAGARENRGGGGEEGGKRDLYEGGKREQK